MSDFVGVYRGTEPLVIGLPHRGSMDEPAQPDALEQVLAACILFAKAPA